MAGSVWLAPRVMFAALLSSLVLLASPLRAHEVQPAIADMTQSGARLDFSVRVNLEGLLAGVDLTAVADTNDAPQAQEYDRLRALDPAGLGGALDTLWPDIAAAIDLQADGARIPVLFDDATIPDAGDVSLPRESVLTFHADLPPGAQAVTFGWDSAFGTIVLRQQGVDAPYTGYLEAGARSEPVTLTGGGEVGQWQTFFDYIPVGYDHILPKGLDHILFVLGLFFLSTRWRPLLWQVTAFTVAHTITLALAAAGYVSIPASIVEPLIAASITFVAVENILTDGLSRWRPFVVFGFGLLHGLGFASVLGQFGLPEGAFFPALIGFNIGVEFGQLTVIAAAFLAFGLWFGRKTWYRRVISTPASAAIGFVGAYWVLERTVL